MTLPGSYTFTLLLLLLSMLCWGSWANTFKVAGKWRFELFYFDFAIGVFVVAIIAAFTFGTLGLDGFSVMDDLQLAGKRQDMFAFAAGCVFNLANMLLMAAIAVAGMAVAFPVGIGLALIIGVAVSYLVNPAGNPVLLAAGCIAILGAIILDAKAFSVYTAYKAQLAAQAAAAEAEARAADPTASSKPAPRKKKKKSASSGKGIVLALAGGVLMGLFYPIVELARQGENGLGPYTIGLFFSVGVLLSTFVLNLFFMNLPVQGQAIEFSDYFKGTVRQHLLGLVGGGLWYIGAISNFVAARAEGKALVGPAVSYAMGQGATLVSALWGLLVWKEFAEAESDVRILIGAMLILFVAGLTAVSLAPLYAR
ncbi:MAG: AcrB/AcrD/AcrF family protein [Acidobacteriota bacterium]|nr:AcrB/AcrD/AcrF family protein [Acidobacteriota bacterium]